MPTGDVPNLTLWQSADRHTKYASGLRLQPSWRDKQCETHDKKSSIANYR